MVTLYSGTPGSGKSLHTAKDILEFAKSGLKVVTNFPLNIENISKNRGWLYRNQELDIEFIDNNNLTPERLILISNEYFLNHNFKEGKILLVIDECQLIFNSREWQRTGRNEWLSFFTQHRKYGYNIQLVAQFDRMIDRQIRSLIENEVSHRQVKNFGMYGKIVSFLFMGKMFCAITYYYPLHERLSATFFGCSKKYYSLYDTNFRFGDDSKKNDHSLKSNNFDKEWNEIVASFEG